VNTEGEVSVVLAGHVGKLGVDLGTPLMKFSLKDGTCQFLRPEPELSFSQSMNEIFKRTYSKDGVGYEVGGEFRAARWLVVEVKVALPPPTKLFLPPSPMPGPGPNLLGQPGYGSLTGADSLAGLAPRSGDRLMRDCFLLDPAVGTQDTTAADALRRFGQLRLPPEPPPLAKPYSPAPH
jgi:hypothetical protein